MALILLIFVLYGRCFASKKINEFWYMQCRPVHLGSTTLNSVSLDLDFSAFWSRDFQTTNNLADNQQLGRSIRVQDPTHSITQVEMLLFLWLKFHGSSYHSYFVGRAEGWMYNCCTSSIAGCLYCSSQPGRPHLDERHHLHKPTANMR